MTLKDFSSVIMVISCKKKLCNQLSQSMKGRDKMQRHPHGAIELYHLTIRFFLLYIKIFCLILAPVLHWGMESKHEIIIFLSPKIKVDLISTHV